MNRPSPRTSAEEAPSKLRSRIANGTATLLGAKDERSLYVRRLREVFADHVSDLGGIDAISAGEKSIVRRVAVLTVELEKIETRFAEDPSVGERTLDLYNRTAGNLGRLLDRLGLKRRTRDITPTLASYLESQTADMR